MKMGSHIRVLAGSLVLLSLILTLLTNPWWLTLACFVALNLVQSAFTGFCALESMFRQMGWLTGPRAGETKEERPR